jgi:hypothetical protein
MKNIQILQRKSHLIIITSLVLCILPLTVNQVTAESIAAHAGLVSWWPGDWDAYDIIGDNHGTPLYDTTYALGKVDGAFRFNGGSDWISAPTEGISGLQALTIEMWVQHYTVPNNIQRYVTLSVEKAVLRHAGGGTLQFYMNFGSATDWVLHYLMVDDALNVGDWNHIAGTYDGSYMRLYLNGVEVENKPVVGTVYAGDSQVSISSPGEAMVGHIDEVAIYDNALSLTEIQAIYNADSDGREKPKDIAVSPTSYDFDHVEVGESSSGIVTVRNVGDDPLVLEEVSFLEDSCTDLSISMYSDQVNDFTTGISEGSANGGSLYQSFSANASGLVGVSLRFQFGGSFPDSGYTTTIKVRSETIDGPILGTASSFISAPQVSEANREVLFKFPEVLPTTFGGQYIIEWVYPETQGIINWMSADTDPYPGGNFFGSLEKDVAFATYVTKPTIDQINDATPYGSHGMGIGWPGSFFQSFTTSTTSLGAIVLGLTPGGAFPDSGVINEIKIRHNTPDGPVLATGVTIIPGPLSTNIDVRYQIMEPIALTPGDTYVIEWISPLEGGSFLKWRVADGDPYSGGTAINSDYIPYEGEDFRFSTYNSPFVLPRGLYANQEFKIAVDYNPSISGYCMGTLQITSTDPDEPVVDVRMFGRATNLPVSWWPGDKNSFDIIGNNHGIMLPIEPGRTGFSSGMVEDAFDFDGINDYVAAPATGIEKLQHLTIEAWVKLNSLPDRIMRFMTLGPPGLERAVIRYGALSPSGYGQLHFYMRIGEKTTDFTHLAVDGVLQSEKWHHVAGTYDGRYMRLYLDGAEIAIHHRPGPVAIGENWGVELGSRAPETLDGSLDEAKVYGYPLSAEEIQSIFLSGSAGQPKPTGELTLQYAIPVITDVVLTHDLRCEGDGLVIEASDVIVSGSGGHKIIGSGSGTGIAIQGHFGVTIINLVISSFNTGILIDECGDINVSVCYLTDNDVGLSIKANMSSITRNIIVNNLVGVQIVEQPQIVDQYGEIIQVAWGYWNSIYINLLINNDDQIQEAGINFWFNWWLKLGNFWSNYWGVDDGSNGRVAGDGVGDTDLPHEGVDPCPLLDPSIPMRYGELPVGDDWWEATTWLIWRGGWSPVDIQVTDPLGQVINRDINEIGMNAFFVEDDQWDPVSTHIMVLIVVPIPENPSPEEFYTFQMTAQDDLTYSMEWFLSYGDAINRIGGKVLYERSVEDASLNEGQTQVVETPVAIYTCSGILQPINADGSSVFKLGRTVPVKFQLFDDLGMPVGTAFATIDLIKISDGVTGVYEEATSTSAADTGNIFRYDSETEQYIYNLNTDELETGTYVIRIIFGVGQIFEVTVSFR